MIEIPIELVTVEGEVDGLGDFELHPKFAHLEIGRNGEIEKLVICMNDDEASQTVTFGLA